MFKRKPFISSSMKKKSSKKSSSKKQVKPIAEAPPVPELSEKAKAELVELNNLFNSLKYYPVALEESKKESTLSALLEKYKKGEDYYKQTFLYIAYETLVQFSDYREPRNYGFYQKLNPQEKAQRLKLNVYRTMFDYSSSLEGMLELISLLGKINDVPSAKLLTHLFMYYGSRDSLNFKLLRTAVIIALGESNSLYALKSLLSYIKYVDSEDLLNRVIDAIIKWDEKIETLGLPEKETQKLKKELKEILTIAPTDSPHGYVR